MSLIGWEALLKTCSFRGEGKYPIAAYSEFMPPVRVGCRPYGGKGDGFFHEENPLGFPVTEFEEALELRPGLQQIANQVLGALLHLARGESAEGLAKGKLVNNPYWPPELATQVGTLAHERFVIILPLALSRTQDDKGRRRWTLFGGSEQGPSRPFWKSFFTSPGKEIPAVTAMGSIATLLGGAYGGPSEKWTDLYRVGFRIFAEDGDPHKTLRPTWTSSFVWTRRMPLQGVKYLLNFEPFGNLPETVKKTYLAGELHLIPFPGSLCFWGIPGYVQMQRELSMANQIPLLHLVERHEAPYGLRVPQAGWIHVPRPDHPSPHEDFGPIKNTFQRTHRWARVHRYDDELSIPGRLDQIVHVLFSTDPKDLDLYGKPMARNSQIWTQDHHLLLDGPNATQKEIRTAIELIKQGGLFGYRLQYPPMVVGSHQIFWHRPLIAYLSLDTGKPVVLPDILLGYLTAYDAMHLDLNHPIELWPQLYQRNIPLTVIELFKENKHQHKTITRALNLVAAQELLGQSKIPRSFARQILMLPEGKTLDEWLESLPEFASHNERGQWLTDQLRDLVEAKERPLLPSKGKRLPVSLTFDRSTRRSFEVQYWKDIVCLSAGKYVNKANSDCIQDPVTQGKLKQHHRDLEALGDYLLAYYRRVVATRGMRAKALVGDLPFRWKTDFDFDWWEGWVRNQDRRTEERNLMVVIPGRDRKRAVIMADHYDTAYMEDIYYKDQGGSGARLAASGADDNHSATAALMRAAPIFCDMSREGKLGCDIWLIHLTGEEFPSDCLGARYLSQQLVEGTLKLRLAEGGERDLSKVQIQGAFVLDMVAHNSDSDRDKFQISPGRGAEAMWLAYQAHIANEIWNAYTLVWNGHPSRRNRGPGKRSADKKIIPEIALHPKLDGQIRLPRDPKSTLYNTDGQIFSDVGIPVVLFMENYDINRKGYHDSHDTMANIDLDYGSAVVAIAIEAVARAASEKPFRF
jgi:Peptidase family M28